MRLTIFWRVILAQSALVALALALGLYAISALHELIRLDNSILALDSACIDEEKRLTKIFLAEIRHAEKYLVSRDGAFYDGFTQSGSDFEQGLARVGALIDTQRERELTDEIRELHSRYQEQFRQAIAKKQSREQLSPELGDAVFDRINHLIRLREQTMEEKTAAARDHAVDAANVMGWLTLGGIAGALLLAYLHARGVSRPLKELAREMHQMGRGHFARSRTSHAPREVAELIQAFNQMSEELEQLDRLKADFTAHISHELRTPLTAIREGTALLLEGIPGSLSDSQREIIEVVRSHSERLFTAISAILDLSKMEAEMMEYEFTPCDPTALLYRSIEQLRVVAAKKKIDLQTYIADDLPLLELDERRIRQVFDNLLSNALKFTREGGRVVMAAQVWRNRDQGARQVKIIVSDTGPGIPEEDLERVFKRFYQSTAGRAENHRGTGLGLAIARHIVEAHKGCIRVESLVGQGSNFVVTLPVASAVTEGAEATEARG